MEGLSVAFASGRFTVFASRKFVCIVTMKVALLAVATSLSTSVAHSSSDELVASIARKRSLLSKAVGIVDEEKKNAATSAAPDLTQPIVLKKKSNKQLRRSLQSRTYAKRPLAETPSTCDAAFIKCLNVDDCVSCFLELQANDIDWASVSEDTPCSDVVTFLQDKNHCNYLSGKDEVTEAFCSTFEACVVWDDDGSSASSSKAASGNDFPQIDCKNLTECKWDGFHPSFLGNGICNDFGCYNTDICDWDGGDCCPDTCETTSSLVECGHDGFACRDPSSKNCEYALTGGDCDYDYIDDDDDDYARPECGSDESMYRIVMYDSFGDGWDATQMTIKPTGKSRVVFVGSLEKGSQGTKLVCLSKEPSCYDVAVKGGVWGNEVSWEVKPLTEAPSIASGGAPMDCTFSAMGGNCETTCNGKPNVDPSEDSEYKELHELFDCIKDKCIIQVGACEKDDLCKKCFQANTEDYCYANDLFNAVVDCSLCRCSESKQDSDFCATKTRTMPPANPNKQATSTSSSDTKSCSPDETLRGGAAVMTFGQCTDMDQVGMMVTDFDQNHFGELDKFESCAHAYSAQDEHGGHTALGCMQILANAINAGSQEPEEGVPENAVAALANLIYHDAESFCDCAKNASDICPFCISFVKFKTLLYESLDACTALDEIDCAAWNEFYTPCQRNMQAKFSQAIDFKSDDQCEFVKTGCGGVGPFPSFRRLDCEAELPDKSAWDFYNQFASACVEGFDKKKEGYKPVPAPAPRPVKPPTVPIKPKDNVKPQETDKKPYVPPEEKDKKDYTPPEGKEKKDYVPPEDNEDEKKEASEWNDDKEDFDPPDSKKPDKKPYIPPEEKPGYKPKESQSSAASSPEPATTKKKGRFRWFWNLVWLCVIGGGAYYVYKRRADGFSFIRYRRMRNNYFNTGGDADMYSGLALESSTTFEPPSLPPTPSSMGGSAMFQTPQGGLS